MSRKPNRVIKNCLNCGKQVSIHFYRRNTFKFCSYHCHSTMPGFGPQKTKFQPREKHTMWKGGIRYDRRNDPAYRLWRKDCCNRDGWKCKINNQDCCGKLIVHHILSWRDHPELRYDINNGITLCQFHHPRVWDEEKRMIPTFAELLSVSKAVN